MRALPPGVTDYRGKMPDLATGAKGAIKGHSEVTGGVLKKLDAMSKDTSGFRPVLDRMSMAATRLGEMLDRIESGEGMSHMATDLRSELRALRDGALEMTTSVKDMGADEADWKGLEASFNTVLGAFAQLNEAQDVVNILMASDTYDGVEAEMSHKAPEVEGASFQRLVLDQRDAVGLGDMAFKIGRMVDQLQGASDGKKPIVIVAGASPEVPAAVLKELRPDIDQVHVMMSGIEDEHMSEFSNSNVQAYLRESLGEHADSDRPIIILDATDTGKSQALLRSAIKHMDHQKGNSRRVVPVSLNKKEKMTVEFDGKKTTIHPVPGEGDTIGRVRNRFQYQMYKHMFPRSAGKVPFDKIVKGDIKHPPPMGVEEKASQRQIAKAIVSVWAERHEDGPETFLDIEAEAMPELLREDLHHERLEALSKTLT